jgi:hypothetical protein
MVSVGRGLVSWSDLLFGVANRPYFQPIKMRFPLFAVVVMVLGLARADPRPNVLLIMAGNTIIIVHCSFMTARQRCFKHAVDRS